MLRWRLILGAAFIGGIIGLCWLDHRLSPPGLVLLPLALALSLLASGEFLLLATARGLRPSRAVVYAGNLLIVAANAVPAWWLHGEADFLGRLGWPCAAFTVMVLAAFCREMARYDGPGRVMEQLSTTILALAYVGLLFSFLAQMRLLGNGMFGVPALASLVIVVKMGDTGAYTVGRLIGRHKLVPRLSPGKTVEGAIGGLAFACFGSWLAFHWLLPLATGSQAAPSSFGWLAYGLIVGVAGMLGDLAESLLKRDAGRKDSSDWMPGFGGVLDVLDSILFAAPVAYICWACGLVP